MPAAGVCAAEVVPESRLAPELSCCLQDSGVWRPAARFRQRNALGRKLSCCWQDRAAAASDPGLVAVAGCFRRRLDCSAGADASNRDGWHAISGSYPDRPDGIPDRKRSYGGGFQSADAAGTPTRCRPIDRAGTLRVGRPAHNSDNAVRPYRRCLTELDRGKSFRNYCRVGTASSPMALSFNYKTGETAVVLFRR